MDDRDRRIRLGDLVDNPEFLLYRINLARRELHFLEVTRRTFDDSSFLDDRIAHTTGRLHGVGLDELAGLMERVPRRDRPVHFLAHTSFCCSTLLARTLRLARHTLVLREPLILRLLGDARRHGARAGSPAQQRQYLDLALRLLDKTFHDGQQVIVKPANLANVLLDDWLALQPESRGAILTSQLDDYLVSTLKKPPATWDKMPWVAEALGRDTDYFQQVPEAHRSLDDPLRAAAVAWHAQRYRLAGLIADYPGRLLALEQTDLLEYPDAALGAVTAHLGLAFPRDQITSRVHGSLWHHHAKNPRQHYDGRQRQRENQALRQRHSRRLANTMDWARDHLLASLPVGERLPGTWQPDRTPVEAWRGA